MRMFILAAALAATVASAAVAQPGGNYDDRRDYHDRHDRGDDRRGDHDHDRDFADRGGRGGRDWQRGRQYDWNRPDPQYGRYDAARYYRDDRSYRERRLGRADRVYAGSDGRYYCRRTDGTTGLILGGVLGGALGNSVARGGSTTLAMLIGAAGGAALGSSIDRGNVRCR